MTTGTVYRITNEFNGYVYIGSTLHQKARLARHIRHLRKGKHRNKFLQRDFDKVGEKWFVFEILHTNIPEENLHLYELSEIRCAELNEPGVYNISRAARISPAKRAMLLERKQLKLKELYRYDI